MGLIKEKYRQFRQWQQQPFEYHDSHDHHGCCNCGAESENNYCPRCGQKAVYGPITWHSVWQGILDVWGMGTRSLPYTLWQLVWRPGYLMRDYISGKRQVSFPPVKMLVVVGVVILLLGNWLDPGAVIEEDPVAPTGLRHYIDVAFNWLNRNMEWWVLLLFSLMIVPIWSLFREAPKYPHHTLPQGFYIQVFASTQFLLWMMLIAAFGELFLDTASNYAGLIVFIFLVPLMLLIDFKHIRLRMVGYAVESNTGGAHGNIVYAGSCSIWPCDHSPDRAGHGTPDMDAPAVGSRWRCGLVAADGTCGRG